LFKVKSVRGETPRRGRFGILEWWNNGILRRQCLLNPLFQSSNTPSFHSLQFSIRSPVTWTSSMLQPG